MMLDEKDDIQYVALSERTCYLSRSYGAQCRGCGFTGHILQTWTQIYRYHYRGTVGHNETLHDSHKLNSQGHLLKVIVMVRTSPSGLENIA